jgi:hypothetical protein
VNDIAIYHACLTTVLGTGTYLIAQPFYPSGKAIARAEKIAKIAPDGPIRRERRKKGTTINVRTISQSSVGPQNKCKFWTGGRTVGTAKITHHAKKERKGKKERLIAHR